jgi:hypothetical protein
MSEEQDQPEVLLSNLDKPPSELDIEDLLPVFVPISFFEYGNWPGPYEALQVPGLGLTWAVLQPEQTMRYVSHRVEAHWVGKRIPWRDIAVHNIQRHSIEGVWTHEFRGEDGALFAVAMMHPDGLGPSRLLLRESLERLFPEGYVVALPEMSCGLVLSTRAADAERSKILGIVTDCFENGTRPLVPGLHEASKIELRPEGR